MEPVTAATGAAAKLGAGGVGLLALSAVWLGQVSEVHGIPQRAAVAYVEAGRLEGCDWRDLAAVGWAESGHGTSRVDGVQREINADGVVEPALEVWDVIAAGGGPMGFLVPTWEQGGYEAAFPGGYQDVDDAARATCRYLRAKGYDTDRGCALQSYNAGNCAGSAGAGYRDKTLAYAAGLPPDPGGEVPAQAVASASEVVGGGRRSLGASLEAAWQGAWGWFDRAKDATDDGDTPTIGGFLEGLDSAAEVVAPRADSQEMPELPAQPGTKPAPEPEVGVVDLGGIRVDGSVAGQVRAMLDAAAADGVELVSSPRGSFRSQAEQLELRSENGCPDVWESDAFECAVPTARPGRSLHEHGLAVDFGDGGGAWGWLAGNAGRFGGAVDVPGEPWHVSFTPVT